MMEIPKRVRVLIVGGGIHGVGAMHDLASRGWRDVHLVEKAKLIGSGTSSRSTKLIHGGLRYLKNIRDFGLVAEALQERKLLMELAGDLVAPIELVFPVLKRGGMPRWMIKSGLMLYDVLAGRHGIKPHAYLSEAEVLDRVPIVKTELFRKYYTFWDAQTDDLGLVERVAQSALKLGASMTEGAQACRLQETDDGWLVDIKGPDGTVQQTSALYVINCAGPWAHGLLEASRLTPVRRAVNNRGSHLLLGDLGLKAGLFLQSPNDDRIFFMLPWQGHTLVGTTEDAFDGNPDSVEVTDSDVNYLLGRCNHFLTEPIHERHILSTFAGLRWLAVDGSKSLSSTSRSYFIGEHVGRRGLVMTVYGGKLTTYRRLAKTLGDRITSHFGEFVPSKTHEQNAWSMPHELRRSLQSINQRFAPQAKLEGA